MFSKERNKKIANASWEWVRVDFLFITKKTDFAVCLFYDSFYINRWSSFTYHRNISDGNTETYGGGWNIQISRMQINLSEQEFWAE